MSCEVLFFLETTASAASVQGRISLHSSVSSNGCTNNMQTTYKLPKTVQFAWNWFFIWETVTVAIRYILLFYINFKSKDVK